MCPCECCDHDEGIWLLMRFGEALKIAPVVGETEVDYERRLVLGIKGLRRQDAR